MQKVLFQVTFPPSGAVSKRISSWTEKYGLKVVLVFSAMRLRFLYLQKIAAFIVARNSFEYQAYNNVCRLFQRTLRKTRILPGNTPRPAELHADGPDRDHLLVLLLARPRRCAREGQPLHHDTVDADDTVQYGQNGTTTRSFSMFLL